MAAAHHTSPVKATGTGPGNSTAMAAPAGVAWARQAAPASSIAGRAAAIRGRGLWRRQKVKVVPTCPVRVNSSIRISRRRDKRVAIIC